MRFIVKGRGEKDTRGKRIVAKRIIGFGGIISRGVYNSKNKGGKAKGNIAKRAIGFGGIATHGRAKKNSVPIRLRSAGNR